jgi:hypothetical protein
MMPSMDCKPRVAQLIGADNSAVMVRDKRLSRPARS